MRRRSGGFPYQRHGGYCIADVLDGTSVERKVAVPAAECWVRSDDVAEVTSPINQDPCFAEAVEDRVRQLISSLSAETFAIAICQWPAGLDARSRHTHVR